MKVSLIFFSILVLCFACADQIEQVSKGTSTDTLTTLEVPSNTIDKSKIDYNKKTSLWTQDGQLFSGYAVTYFPNRTIAQKIGILDGKKQNETEDWFPDGHLHKSSNYYKGRLHGSKRTWSSDSTHILISDLNYYAGKAHGIQKKWYPTGELYKILQLDMGKESGMQQAFRKNGELFANYEARDNRIYGIKKAALCFGLEDEVVQE